MNPTYDYNTGQPLVAGQAQSQFNNQTGQAIGAPTSSITTTSLAPQAPVTLPAPTAPIAAPSLQGLIDAGYKSTIEGLQPTVDTAKTQQTDYKTQLDSIFTQLANKGAATASRLHCRRC